MKKQINEGLADRLRGVLGRIRASKAESDKTFPGGSREEPTYEPTADIHTNSPTPPAVKAPHVDTDPAQTKVDRMSEIFHQHSQNVKAMEKVKNHCRESLEGLSKIVDEHERTLGSNDTLNELKGLTRKLESLHRKAHAAQQNSRYELRLFHRTNTPSITTPLDRSFRPPKPAIKPKYDSVEQVRKDTTLTKK